MKTQKKAKEEKCECWCHMDFELVKKLKLSPHFCIHCHPEEFPPQSKQEEGWEELLGAIARGWCHPKNSKKVLDSDLVLAIAEQVQQFISSTVKQERLKERKKVIEEIKKEYYRNWNMKNDDVEVFRVLEVYSLNN